MIKIPVANEQWMECSFKIVDWIRNQKNGTIATGICFIV